METVKVNLYSIDELDKPIQLKIINRNRDLLVSDSYWYEGIIEQKQIELSKLGFNRLNFLFNGLEYNSSMAIEGYIDADIYIEVNKLKEFNRLIPLIKEGLIDFTFSKPPYNHNYNRYYGYIEINYNIHSVDRYKRIIKLCNKLKDLLEEENKNICKHVFRLLRDEYEALTSDEIVFEALMDLDYRFLKDGTVFRS